ncbi:MAG TPA: hypothetical protein ENH10_02215 [Bacteroidetes bacterium]|nr:hypothetical protein [Bacteroidota bacterium]HEX03955.1 hypothetical protein [Bacteroidota bacterium]
MYNQCSFIKQVSSLSMSRDLASDEWMDKESMVIVSGLPRSGTSLVMQMLQAGGMSLLVDERRVADVHNPRGYFEYDPVKRIKQDISWLPLAQGKAVKIVVPLVNVVAMLEVNATVLLIRREMSAVMLSQKRMAEAGGVSVSDEDQTRLRLVFERELVEIRSLIEANPLQQLIELRFEDVLQNPLSEANRLAIQIPMYLDAAAMASAVDTGLNRSGDWIS